MTDKEIIEKLNRENELLKKRIEKLEKLLLAYENPHTPPSKERFKERPLIPDEDKKKNGQKENHEGITRPQAKPDKIISVTATHCHCNRKLGLPVLIESKIIEEIPKPQPVIVIQYDISHYYCSCGAHIIASHPDCPKEGRFGKNLLSHIALLKFEDRLPHRKISEALIRDYKIKISPGSIFDCTRRVADALAEQHKQLMKKIRRSTVVYVDETEIKVQGKTYHLWVFTTNKITVFVIRKSRGEDVIKEVLGKKFKYTIVCDGWRVYASYTGNLQRCWAHLLREAESLANKVHSAKTLYEGLRRIFIQVKAITKRTPEKLRQKIHNSLITQLQQWVDYTENYKELRKFGTKIKNGIKYWCTRVLNPKIEPTNNLAEQKLREP
ncbi:MAG: IS66 family transposase, partial [Nanoarchaeota archaeon]